VPPLVEGVAKVESSEQSVAGELGRARQVSPSVVFGFGETQKLVAAPVRVAKYEPMQRIEDALDTRRVDQRRACVALGYPHAPSSATIRPTFPRLTFHGQRVSVLRDRGAARFFLHALAAAPGAALLAWAFRSSALWFDRHVLPNYCPCAGSTLALESLARWGATFAGIAWILFFRAWIVSWLARRPGGDARRLAARITAAVVVALVVCDVSLRIKEGRHRLEDEPGLPPMRLDETGNYVPIPSRSKESNVEGRYIRYEIDADGNRSASLRDSVDHVAPTILFTGESIALGWGVDYEESYAPRVGRALGVQAVNLAVTGFANDQAYLRLREALPRFAHPLALVTLVVPVQLARNVDDRRARLALRDGRLELAPASTSPLFTSPLRKLVPYHSDETLALALAIFRATNDLARTRGARALFVMTNFGPPCLVDESGASRLERTLFSGLDAPHVRVDLVPAWMIGFPNEVHPSERGHQAIADAILSALKEAAVARP